MRQSTHLSKTILAMLLCIASASCEKPIIDDGEETGKWNKSDMAEITFRSFSTSQSTFDADNMPAKSRDAGQTPITELCTRISLAIFNADNGEKVSSTNQDKSNASFGKITASLTKGRYAVVAIAHNGEGNATISTPAKITFKNNKVTDTFYYYGTIDVENDNSYDMTMKRAVAMFQLIVKDATPPTIRTMKFYYTGGSSTFDATTGYGCVNSMQTELRTIPSTAYTSASSYDIYTFPHEGDKKLKIEVSALENATDTKATYAKTFENVDITRNHVSRYYGYFYGEDPSTGRSFDFTTSDEWEYDDYEY